MVSNSRRSDPRPLWILKIHKRLSMHEFKKEARYSEADIKWVLKGPPTKTVYKVTVETMENCGTPESEQLIWVTEEMARATGEMLERFEEEEEETTLGDKSHEDINETTESIAEDYSELRKSEEVNPYDTEVESHETTFDFSSIDDDDKGTSA
ncbi:hypothetical protein B9Z55_001415 [Caenorhabditis nigoni]|uniref:Uncharacterized protein n=1 Tax=Caenorhabditis nigoni TaxID=1611254 RepID=A0A2G5VFL2_9PELO|nr:hypothetical protein B9Z55_001415 [Caenorhabditis nigoni]